MHALCQKATAISPYVISGLRGRIVGEMPTIDVRLADLAQIRAKASVNEGGDTWDTDTTEWIAGGEASVPFYRNSVGNS